MIPEKHKPINTINQTPIQILLRLKKKRTMQIKSHQKTLNFSIQIWLSDSHCFHYYKSPLIRLTAEIFTCKQKNFAKHILTKYCFVRDQSSSNITVFPKSTKHLFQIPIFTPCSAGCKQDIINLALLENKYAEETKIKARTHTHTKSIRHPSKLRWEIKGKQEVKTFGVIILILDINILFLRLLIWVLKPIILHIRICKNFKTKFWIIHKISKEIR